MSFGVRPRLRPVDWSDIDAKGRSIRRQRQREPSPEPYYPSTSDPGYPPAKRRKQGPLELPPVYYPPTLSPSEKIWRDRCGYLYQRGYQLRPRYQPNWTPTCLGNGRHYHSGEDHTMQILPQVLDGVRRQDGLVVCIKMIQDPKKMRQIKVVEYFSTRRMSSDTRNHVVPFYDTFGDSFSPHIQYMVMPVLRKFDDPEFLSVCEVVDFVSQVLEGLSFLHENNVAHHNLTGEHIMMDAKSIIPTGWHFVSHFCEPDGMTKISPLERKHLPVRYYFVGFGNCYHIPPNTTPLVRDIGGNDGDVPELLAGKPYDPFKLDIYTLGNVFLKDLLRKYHSLDFLNDLIDYMRTSDFTQRPNAQMVLRLWYRIRDGLDEDAIENWRLRFKDPNVRPRYSEEPSSAASSTRSNKRDISSILNL